MLGAIIGAAGSLIGGMRQNKENKKARAQEYANQKEFAQSGIKWKVDDAKRAGIHPLYALGANTVSYAPQSVGGSDFSFMGDAGQNLGRAIDATRSTHEKASALSTTAAEIQLEGLKLDNEFKKVQLASAMATAAPTGPMPGMPSPGQRPGPNGIDGQGNTPQFDGPLVEVSKKYAPTNAGAPHQEYAHVPEVQFARTSDGGYAPTIPQQMAESYEQDMIGRWQWAMRNKYGPSLGANDGLNPYHQPPTHISPRHGERWYYDVVRGAWYLRPGFRDHWLKQ